MIIAHVGGIQCIKPVDAGVWVYAMINESCDQPKFYSNETQQIFDELLFNLRGIHQGDITSDNCRDIYIELVDVFNSLHV